MIIRKTSRCFLLTVLLFTIGGSCVVHAQHKNENKKNAFVGIERWAFKTNVIDWVTTIPNFSVEYDLSGAENNKMTLGLTARYNWKTAQNPLPYRTFDLLQLRPEYRYYWRPTKSRRAISRNQVNYAGAYVDGGMYTFKAGEYGHKGQIYTVGLSLGYGMPKYQYKKGYIDMEIGFALGLAMTTDDAFVLDREANAYSTVTEKSKGLHIAPFPIASSLNVSFAWRSRSIKDKYKFTDADKIRRQEKESEREQRRNARKLKKEHKKEKR